MSDILIAPSSFGDCGDEPLEMIKAAGFTFALNPYRRKLSGEELVELAAGCIGIIAGVEEYPASVLDRLPSLKCISRCGVGTDSIDMAKAAGMGIKVLNTPEGPTEAVSELAVGLILNLLRKINLADAALKSGRWIKFHGSLLRGKTVGIIGMGRIGRSTARLLAAFGAPVLFYDPFVEEADGMEKVSLERLLESSDIVVLHLSWKKSSACLIGEREMNMMKKGAYLINLARGGVVDESALLRKLTDGTLSGAALDVFEVEPYSGELTKLENVILTPHIGSYAKEAKLKMEIDAVRNLLGTMKGT